MHDLAGGPLAEIHSLANLIHRFYPLAVDKFHGCDFNSIARVREFTFELETREPGLAPPTPAGGLPHLPAG